MHPQILIEPTLSLASAALGAKHWLGYSTLRQRIHLNLVSRLQDFNLFVLANLLLFLLRRATSEFYFVWLEVSHLLWSSFYQQGGWSRQADSHFFRHLLLRLVLKLVRAYTVYKLSLNQGL